MNKNENLGTLRINYKINSYNFLYYIAYVSFFVKTVLFEKSQIDSMLNVKVIELASTICTLLFLINCIIIMLLLQTYTKKEIYIIFLLIILFSISALQSRSITLISGLILIISSKKIDFDKFSKLSLIIQMIVVGFIITLALSGSIDVGTNIRYYNGEIRYALGFRHPNTLAMLSFQMICQYIYIKRKKNSYKKYLISLLSIVVIYRITDSNTALLMSLSVIFLTLIYEKIIQRRFNYRKIEKIVKKMLKFSGSLVLIICGYFWMNPDRLNAITMVSRIRLIKNYFEAYGINLFGNKIIIGTDVTLPGLSTGYYYLDNAYAWILIKFGVLVFICLLFAYIIYFRKLIQHREFNMVIIVFVYLIYAISEINPFIIVFNSTMIGLSSIIYSNKYKSRNKDGRKDEK